MKLDITPISTSPAIFAGFEDCKIFDKNIQDYITDPTKLKIKFAVRCASGRPDNPVIYTESQCFDFKIFISLKVDKKVCDSFLSRGIKEGMRGNLQYLSQSLKSSDNGNLINYYSFIVFDLIQNTNNAPPKMPATASA